MNQNEMATAIAADKRSRSKTYREISDESKAAAIAADVSFKTAGLMEAANRDKVNFSDLDDVKRRTENYMRACQEAGALPSFLGLAGYGYGLSRQAVYKYLTEHHGEEAAEFVELARDAIADILAAAALRRDADNSTAIFVLKNSHGFSDVVQIQPVPQADPLGTVTTAEALASRYSDLPED